MELLEVVSQYADWLTAAFWLLCGAAGVLVIQWLCRHYILTLAAGGLVTLLLFWGGVL